MRQSINFSGALLLGAAVFLAGTDRRISLAAAEPFSGRFEFTIEIPRKIRLLGPATADGARPSIEVMDGSLRLADSEKLMDLALWDLVPVGEFGRYLVLRTRNPAKRDAKQGDPDQFLYVAFRDEKKADAPLVLVTDEKKALQWELFSSGKKEFLLSTTDFSTQPFFFGAKLTLAKSPLVFTWDDR